MNRAPLPAEDVANARGNEDAPSSDRDSDPQATARISHHTLEAVLKRSTSGMRPVARKSAPFGAATDGFPVDEAPTRPGHVTGENAVAHVLVEREGSGTDIDDPQTAATHDESNAGAPPEAIAVRAPTTPAYDMPVASEEKHFATDDAFADDDDPAYAIEQLTRDRTRQIAMIVGFVLATVVLATIAWYLGSALRPFA